MLLRAPFTASKRHPLKAVLIQKKKEKKKIFHLETIHLLGNINPFTGPIQLHDRSIDGGMAVSGFSLPAGRASCSPMTLIESGSWP